MKDELSPPRRVMAEATKQKIYQATERILEKKGYAYLTVNNICAAAGISNGAFFYHFKTKDDLFIFYTYDKFAAYRQAHDFDETVRTLPFDEKIIAFYCCWANYMVEMGIDFFSNFYSTKNHSLDVRRWNQREPANIWGFPGICLREARERGQLRDGVSVSHCTEVLGCLIKGAAFDWCLCDGSFDMHDRIREIMVPYLNSLRK